MNFKNNIALSLSFNLGAKMRSDFVMMPHDDPLLVEKKAILVKAKAGDLLLWDSRTVHCNTPGTYIYISSLTISSLITSSLI